MTTLIANPAQEQSVSEQEKGQYTLWQILVIWLAAGVPMWILGWLVYPFLSQNLDRLNRFEYDLRFGLEQFFLQREIDFFKPRLHVLKGVHTLVNHDHA